MIITKQTVANRIAAYLRHDISLGELVSWAEEAMMEGELAEQDEVVLSDALARLRVADREGDILYISNFALSRTRI
jgi:hypothetical protein